MSTAVIVDLWPPFCDFWSAHEGSPAEEQVRGWLRLLVQLNPEIHARYAASMVEDGLDWEDDLLRYHWPALPARLRQMAEAHDRVLALFEPAAERTRKALGTDLMPVLVIVPVGYGGWATTYQGQPACDIGLDTTVELGWWDAPTALAGLIAHELGHLAHYRWRGDSIEYHAPGPFWSLYCEGFAQVCERLVAGREEYHLTRCQPGWLEWCRQHRAMLAREFLRRVGAGEPLYEFFGSRPELHIEGYRETGYFLGQEVVGAWAEEQGLREVAVAPAEDVIQYVRRALEHLSAEK